MAINISWVQFTTSLQNKTSRKLGIFASLYLVMSEVENKVFLNT